MPILRLFLGFLSLGITGLLGSTAYWCWGFGRNWGSTNGGIEWLEIRVSYPVGMTLLGLLTVGFALAAIYAFFFPSNGK